jgi:hypothetical protein
MRLASMKVGQVAKLFPFFVSFALKRFMGYKY